MTSPRARSLTVLTFALFMVSAVVVPSASAQNLFGITSDGKIYRVATTASPSTVGPVNLAVMTGNVTGLSLTGAQGLTYNPGNGTVRLLDPARKALYEVDPTASTMINDATISSCPAGPPCRILLPQGLLTIQGLASNGTGDKLYYCNIPNSTSGTPCDMHEFTISTNSDQVIGSVPSSLLPVTGLALNPSGDTLYMTTNTNPKELSTLPLAPLGGSAQSFVQTVLDDTITLTPMPGTIVQPCGSQGNTTNVSGLTFHKAALYGSSGNTTICLAGVAVAAGTRQPIHDIGTFGDFATSVIITSLAPVLSEDFYVRDWTESSISHDNGEEPSTNPVWWTTGDVWNRLSPASGGFINDQPSSQPAQNASSGDNFAFVRIHRKGPAPVGSGPTHVTARFLFADYGLDLSYDDLPQASPSSTPTLTFEEGETELTLPDPGVRWDLPDSRSTHVCMAVEISTPNDPFKMELAGIGPGTADQGQLIVDDNNKAQINMDLPAMVRARTPLVSFAVVHNAALFTRDIVLRYIVAPEILKRVPGSKFLVLGQENVPLQQTGELSLNKMAPGENRWIGVAFQVASADEGEYLPVNVEELFDGKIVNGITITPRVSALGDLMRANLKSQVTVLHRASRAFNAAEAEQASSAAQDLLKQRTLSANEYLSLLVHTQSIIRDVASRLAKEAPTSSGFRIQDKFATLQQAVAAGDPNNAANAHATVLNALDALQTMIQKEQGDPADFLQMVRWQAQLYRKISTARGGSKDDVEKESLEFIAAVRRRKASVKEYPALLKQLLPAFRATVNAANHHPLAKTVDNLEKSLRYENVSAIEKAHRQFLLELAAIGRKTTTAKESAQFVGPSVH